MPVIPVYEAQAHLDPDQAPRYRESMASAQAAEQTGRAVQQLGNQLGSTLSAYAERSQQQAAEQSNFVTGLQERALHQDLSSAYTKSLQSIPATGGDFANAFSKQAEEIARARFDQMPDGPAKDRAMQTWTTLGRETWLDRAATDQFKQAGSYSSDQINRTQQEDLQTVQGSPAAADALFEKARSQIMSSPGLTTDQKLAAVADYQRNLYGTQLGSQYGTDPDGMREALHMAPPGTPGATFSRMIGAESGGKPDAVSARGALGVAQVMPDTAREVAKGMGLADVAVMSDDQLKAYFAEHPDLNRQIGRTYFGQLLGQFNGDQEAAMIGYNAGPTRASIWLQRGKDDTVLPPETLAYRNKVLGPDYSVTHTVTTRSDHLGSVGFDGSAAVVNGKTFGGPVSPVDVARRFEGMSEGANRDTLSAFIAKACGQKVDPSQIPWCASFADAVLGASGKQTLGSARAADFLNYGTATNAPAQGDVVVFKPQSAGRSGHVGFVVGIEGDQVRFVAGNQGNKVQEGTLPLSQVAGFRVPPQAGQASPDGGVFSGRYGALTFADRQKLVANAEAGQRQTFVAEQQQAKLDTYNVQRRVDDDVASLTATGQGVPNLDEGTIARTLGPQKLQEWQDKRAQALDVFKGSAGMGQMTNDELATHAQKFEPGPQDAGEGYGRKAAVYKTIHDHAEAILKQRAEDPAEAVAHSPGVSSAFTAAATVQANPLASAQQKTQANEALVAARIAAQSAVSIPAYARSPISEAEAKQYAALMRPLSRGQMEAGDQAHVIEGIVDEINARYGRYGRDVLNRVLVYTTMKREAADILTNAIVRSGSTSSGPLVTTDEAHKAAVAEEAFTMARRSGSYLAPYDAPAREPEAETPPIDNPMGDFGGGSAALPTAAAPPKQSYSAAVDELYRDPERLMPFFVQRYGADRVPANLRGSRKASAR